MSTVHDAEADDQPQPVFDVGDAVRLTGEDTVYTVEGRNCTVGSCWLYLVDGQHWMEDQLVHVLTKEETGNPGATSNAEPKAESDADDTEVIEVDLGHTHGWALAEVVRTRGKWLHYRLQEPYREKPDKHGGKVQVYARDIL